MSLAIAMSKQSLKQDSSLVEYSRLFVHSQLLDKFNESLSDDTYSPFHLSHCTYSIEFIAYLFWNRNRSLC